MATLNKPIAPQNGYGPIETVISNIDKGLHELGHRSIVACSSDSTVTGEKYETVPRSLGDYCRSNTPAAQAHIDVHLARALARAQLGDIDVVHMHEWFEHVYAGTFNPTVPIVMTLHVPGEHSGMLEFRKQNPHVSTLSRAQPHFVAISDYQRRQYAGLLPVAETIPHGLDVEEYPFRQAFNGGSFLFHIGRIAEIKGQDIAIDVAKRSGAQLILAGCVQDKSEDRVFSQRLMKSVDLVVNAAGRPVTASYYDDVMKPILSSGAQVIYVGELDAAAKKVWYRHARATLFPIRWGEPFGMVLIESMATGTPVIAFGEGAVPEIVRDGETGFVVSSMEGMVTAVGRVNQLDRGLCRRHVQTDFSNERMATRYAALYARVTERPDSASVPEGERLAV